MSALEIYGQAINLTLCGLIFLPAKKNDGKGKLYEIFIHTYIILDLLLHKNIGLQKQLGKHKRTPYKFFGGARVSFETQFYTSPFFSRNVMLKIPITPEQVLFTL